MVVLCSQLHLRSNVFLLLFRLLSPLVYPSFHVCFQFVFSVRQFKLLNLCLLVVQPFTWIQYLFAWSETWRILGLRYRFGREKWQGGLRKGHGLEPCSTCACCKRGRICCSNGNCFRVSHKPLLNLRRFKWAELPPWLGAEGALFFQA